MNRLILIGNGFDLAHGMKTSYYDFISDHIKKACLSAKNGSYKSSLLSINRNWDIAFPNIDYYPNWDQLVLFENESSNVTHAMLEYLSGKGNKREPTKPFTVKFDNKFIELLFTKCQSLRSCLKTFQHNSYSR